MAGRTRTVPLIQLVPYGRAHDNPPVRAETVSEGSMPPWFYLLTHPAARLKAAERQSSIDGLLATFGDGSEHEREGNRP
uniref:Uncharacterized protein n=1 Tax=Thermorudis peleae TaxID=1382356 RepID=A0A831X9F6_9BACT